MMMAMLGRVLSRMTSTQNKVVEIRTARDAGDLLVLVGSGARSTDNVSHQQWIRRMGAARVEWLGRVASLSPVMRSGLIVRSQVAVVLRCATVSLMMSCRVISFARCNMVCTWLVIIGASFAVTMVRACRLILHT